MRWGSPRPATAYKFAATVCQSCALSTCCNSEGFVCHCITHPHGLSMCLGLAGIGALVFTKPCSSTHWSCCSLGFKPPENDFFPPAATLAPKAAAGSLWLGFIAFLLLRWKFRLCIASALIALHSMSSPQCSHSCLVSTNAGSSEICLKHVSERISPKSAMDCIGYGDQFCGVKPWSLGAASTIPTGRDYFETPTAGGPTCLKLICQDDATETGPECKHPAFPRVTVESLWNPRLSPQVIVDDSMLARWICGLSSMPSMTACLWLPCRTLGSSMDSSEGRTPLSEWQVLILTLALES